MRVEWKGANTMTKSLKTLYSLLYRTLIPSSVHAFRERKYWETRRKETEHENHLDIYWNSTSSPNRIWIINEIEEILKRNDKKVSFFEFGSHCGVNLRMLSEKLSHRPIEYFAFDVNEEALEFLKTKLPFVNVIKETTEKYFTQLSDKFDFTLSCGVFYLLPEQKAKLIFKQLARRSRVLIMAESKASTKSVSTFNRTTMEFNHPFDAWAKEFGLNLVYSEQTPESVRSLQELRVYASEGNL